MATSGELFSRVYLERGAPARDSARFRRRLFGYLETHNSTEWYSLSKVIRMGGGIDIGNNSPAIQKFFLSGAIVDVLDFVTLYWRQAGGEDQYYGSKARSWHKFVAKAFEDENLGYQLDSRCGVHYFVDEEFNRNRVSALSVLEASSLTAVRDAFERAHHYLDPGARDTKASVRAAFESLEILAKLMYPDQKNLNGWVIENRVVPHAQKFARDATERDAIKQTFDGLAKMITAMHLYRHGQGTEEPTAPSVELSVYFLSVVASSLRWMALLHLGA
ncbi:MAG: hypothetical protein EON54_19135 [Alcaligenaceae bacterium]|nr:MAG: hypothetical protein EON54_19135 [Alcaligenaceae bacterium]